MRTYPKDLKDWTRWMVMENHELGLRKALTSCGSMDSKGRLRSWKGKISLEAIEKEGHNHLDIELCSCYSNWQREQKARSK